MKKTAKSLFLLLVFNVFLIYLLTSCSSTSENHGFFDTSGVENAEFVYDKYENTTQIIWSIEITNITVCDFKGFFAHFKLYNDSDIIIEKDYRSDDYIKHGDTFSGRYIFHVDGKIDAIELVSVSELPASFFETYKLLIVMMPTVIMAAMLLYTAFILKKDIKLQDAVNFIVSHIIMVILMFSFLLLSIITYGFYTSSWISSLFLLFTLILLPVFLFLAHIIKKLLCKSF